MITVVESPLRINELRPNFCGKDIALNATIASTMSGEKGRGACSESEAIALPRQSRITTPKPDIPKSGNVASSKLILSEPLGGGDHWI